MNLINTLKTLITDSVVPYRNLAVEELLFNSVADGECVLYLWQNFRTVVIGRNQNAFKECETERLAADGGYLVRRLSGGGSVYHDMGNLNFTFVAKTPDYSVDRQLSVISRALAAFGIDCEKTGRNDLTAGGRKFSGNAFYKRGARCLHHGTILVDADMQNMSRYLNVSAEKLKAHGVSSTKNRVVNLKELNGGITIGGLKDALVEAFAEVYRGEDGTVHARAGDNGNTCGGLITLSEASLDSRGLNALTEKYASDEWRYGRNMKADYVIGRRFPWGEIEVRLSLNGNLVEDAQVFTDALNDGLADLIAGRLTGARFSRDALAERLTGLEFDAEKFDGASGAGDASSAGEIADVIEMLRSVEI